LVGRDGRTHPGDPLDVILAVPHRIVRDVHDIVAAGRAGREDRGDSGYGLQAAVEDAIEVDEEEQAGGGHQWRMLPGRRAAWRSAVPARRHRIAEYSALGRGAAPVEEDGARA